MTNLLTMILFGCIISIVLSALLAKPGEQQKFSLIRLVRNLMLLFSAVFALLSLITAPARYLF